MRATCPAHLIILYFITQRSYIEIAVPVRQLLQHTCNAGQNDSGPQALPADSFMATADRLTDRHHGTQTQHSDTRSAYSSAEVESNTLYIARIYLLNMAITTC
jgi:hypothetical protein